MLKCVVNLRVDGIQVGMHRVCAFQVEMQSVDALYYVVLKYNSEVELHSIGALQVEMHSVGAFQVESKLRCIVLVRFKLRCKELMRCITGC